MPSITPFPWFDADLVAAIGFYRSIFPAGVSPGLRRAVDISLFVGVETQEEIDDCGSGSPRVPVSPVCGWLKDRHTRMDVRPCSVASGRRSPVGEHVFA